MLVVYNSEGEIEIKEENEHKALLHLITINNLITRRYLQLILIYSSQK